LLAPSAVCVWIPGKLCVFGCACERAEMSFWPVCDRLSCPNHCNHPSSSSSPPPPPPPPQPPPSQTLSEHAGRWNIFFELVSFFAIGRITALHLHLFPQRQRQETRPQCHAPTKPDQVRKRGNFHHVFLQILHSTLNFEHVFLQKTVLHPRSPLEPAGKPKNSVELIAHACAA